LPRFTATIKVHQNLALQSSRYLDKAVAVSQNICPVSKVKGQTLRKTLAGPTVFVCVEFVANENPSELRGFNASSKFYSKNGHCF